MEIHLSELNLFECSDQPETCRYCGCGTEILWEGQNNRSRLSEQIHYCDNCDGLYRVGF